MQLLGTAPTILHDCLKGRCKSQGYKKQSGSYSRWENIGMYKFYVIQSTAFHPTKIGEVDKDEGLV